MRANTAAESLESCREGGPGREREAMPQRASGEVDFGEDVLGVPREQLPVGAEGVEGLARDPAARVQGAIQRKGGVTL